MVVDFFKGKELEDILKFEFVFNTKKTNLDEFDGKVRKIQNNENQNQNENEKRVSLDEGNTNL